jgi:sialate O-acetylesterase
LDRKLRGLMVAILVCLAMGCSARADVTLSALFSDGMVVQRNMPIHVWGKATPGERVSATFRGETKSASADSLGYWGVYLSPAKAGGPYELLVRGVNEIHIQDVMVGEVWIASGQSNMEFPMRQVDNAEAEIAAANIPEIRLLRVHRASSDYPLYDLALDTPWAKCDSKSVREFSAAAYYFAREIHEKEKVPIGLIQSSWGGTVAEAWTSMQTLSSDAALMPVFAARAKMMEHHVDLPAIQENEKKQQEQARVEGKPIPRFPWHPLQQMWAPAGLYNAMIAPLTPYAIRGVIWYQGESNSGRERAPSYEHLFQAMIRDWRDRWGQGDFPFLFTQIANFKPGPWEDWAEVREAQRRALGLRNTAMAVTIDIGNPDDVHPTNKRDVGRRLALAARATVYREPIEYSGPLFRQLTSEEHALRAWFDHADELQAVGGVVKGFEVAGTDGKFVPAEARVDGTSVIVSSPAVDSPVSVRYGWSNSPECNLQNRAGLPASPFRSSK